MCWSCGFCSLYWHTSSENLTRINRTLHQERHDSPAKFFYYEQDADNTADKACVDTLKIMMAGSLASEAVPWSQEKGNSILRFLLAMLSQRQSIQIAACDALNQARSFPFTAGSTKDGVAKASSKQPGGTTLEYARRHYQWKIYAKHLYDCRIAALWQPSTFEVAWSSHFRTHGWYWRCLS